ncbi:ImmA/IrrE family metallo-endopeptidase [Bacillus haynesii]|uniref:ImmA/IrrE family metallo-endopeptidase n=1 Tax=Bacillus haynesii TaxID=1925021 RepID=UPI0039903A7C
MSRIKARRKSVDYVSSFAELQEMQANTFAYKFCIPLFMLKNLAPQETKTRMITSIFNVTNEFAHKRLKILSDNVHLS